GVDGGFGELVGPLGVFGLPGRALGVGRPVRLVLLALVVLVGATTSSTACPGGLGGRVGGVFSGGAALLPLPRRVFGIGEFPSIPGQWDVGPGGHGCAVGQGDVQRAVGLELVVPVVEGLEPVVFTTEPHQVG